MSVKDTVESLAVAAKKAAREVASLAIDGKTSLPDEAHRKICWGRDFYAASTEALK